MIRSRFEQRPLDAAVADAASPLLEFDQARALRAAMAGVMEPALERIVLVEHPVRGMVPPGGKVEPGECPRVGDRQDAEPVGERGRRRLAEHCDAEPAGSEVGRRGRGAGLQPHRRVGPRPPRRTGRRRRGSRRRAAGR